MSEVKAKVAVSGDPADTVSAKDVFNRLEACRDFEIKLQWERAVFLTAFLIACFAGYGGLLLSVHEHGAGKLSVLILTVMFECISLVGVVLSLLWIMMAKGSKAWYEHYEKAIKAYARQVAEEGEEEAAGGMLVAVKGIEGQKIDSDILFSTDGGPFSVSRIVVLIGQGSLVFWMLALVAHVVSAFVDVRSFLADAQSNNWIVLVPLMIVAMFLGLMWRRVKSKYLQDVRKLP